MNSRKFVTSEEILNQLGCSSRHLANLRARRLIPFFRLGRLIRYDPEAVARALAKLEVKEVS
jgi:hypothetical protein